MDSRNRRYNVPALEKGIAVMETLAFAKEPLAFAEIVDACELPKSSLYAILSTLEELGYTVRDENGKYRITMKIFTLAMSMWSRSDVRTVARPFMEVLSAKLEYTVHLALLYRGQAIYIDKVPGPGFIQFSTKIGQTQALHNSAVGKVLAAYMLEADLDAALEEQGMPQTTPNTITSPAMFKISLQTVRERGFAIEDEEGELGVRCIGAPIFDFGGNVVAAISITAARSQLSSTEFVSVGEILKETCAQISSELGLEQR